MSKLVLRNKVILQPGFTPIHSSLPQIFSQLKHATVFCSPIFKSLIFISAKLKFYREPIFLVRQIYTLLGICPNKDKTLCGINFSVGFRNDFWLLLQVLFILNPSAFPICFRPETTIFPLFSNIGCFLIYLFSTLPFLLCKVFYAYSSAAIYLPVAISKKQ